VRIPVPRSRSAPPTTTRPRRTAVRDPLERAVATGIRQLQALDAEGTRERWTRCRTVETALRAALDEQLTLGPSDAVPAVTIACAYLTATDVEEAYAALLLAADRLRGR
jgi:aspartate aminotransferase-like enzyme